MFDAESDYVVEEFVRPNKTRIPLINDERADILGNFDDSKRKEIESGKIDASKSDNFEENPFEDEESDDDDEEDDNAASETSDKEQSEHLDVNTDSEEPNETATPETDKAKKAKKSKVKTEQGSDGTNAPKDNSNSLSDAQINALLRGSTKKDRFVLYVTNLNYDTTKFKLEEFFAAAGAVKSVRVPKTRKSAFAFIEMADLNGFKVCNNLFI